MKRLIRASTSYRGLSTQDVETRCVEYFQQCLDKYLSSRSGNSNYDIRSELKLFSEVDTKSGQLEEWHLDVYVDFNDGDKYNSLRLDAHVTFYTNENQFLCFGDGVIYARPSHDHDDRIEYYVPGPSMMYRKTNYTFDEILRQYKEYQESWNKNSTVYYKIEEMFPYSELSKLFSQAESKYEAAKVKTTKIISWNSLVSNLESEMEDGIDPLYEETKSGARLLKICSEIESALNLFVEPSVQGGVGSIFIYDKNTEDLISDEIDFDAFNTTILHEATKPGSTEKKFRSWYTQHLKSLIQ